jgi:predicted nuclease of predicted toxin-antitoxin system
VRARLYLDEDVIPELARVLRSAGHDAVSSHELGALGATDEEQLVRAATEGRALLSFNFRHFIRLAREWSDVGRHHAGIVISYRQYRRSELRNLRRAIVRLLDTTTAEDLDDSFYVLDQFR